MMDIVVAILAVVVVAALLGVLVLLWLGRK